MACLPPATLTPLPSRRAERTTDCTASIDANRTIRPATIRRHQREEQKKRARQIGDDADVELARNDEYDERKQHELGSGEAANDGCPTLIELKDGADVPGGEAGHENRQDCGRPEDTPTRTRSGEEESVHGSTQDRCRGDRREENDEPQAQLLVACIEAGERITNAAHSIASA